MIPNTSTSNMGGITSIKILLASQIEAMRFYNGRTQIDTANSSYPQEVFFSYKSASVSCEPVRNSDVFNINISWQVPKYRPDLLDSILAYFNRKCVIEITFSNKEVKIFGSPDNPMIIKFHPTRQSTPEDYNGATISANCIDFAPGRFKSRPLPLPDNDTWFLPSKDELFKMYVNLKQGTGYTPVGNFLESRYHSSTEDSATTNFNVDFLDGHIQNTDKGYSLYVRPIRQFTVTEDTPSYKLRDTVPDSGWIFHVINNQNGTYTYYEAAPKDLFRTIHSTGSSTYAFSNITDVLIGTTNPEIGTGLNNSLDIIAQQGHQYSAAWCCMNHEDFMITY